MSAPILEYAAPRLRSIPIKMMWVIPAVLILVLLPPLVALWTPNFSAVCLQIPLMMLSLVVTCIILTAVIVNRLQIPVFARANRLPLIFACLGLLTVPVGTFTLTKPNFILNIIYARQGKARDNIEKIYYACFTYSRAHRRVDGEPFPPHLAALLAGHYLAPEDLIDPSSSTKPIVLPPGIVEADWPTIASAVDAHCDFVYLGADFVNDSDVNPSFNEILFLYGKTAHFRAGPLVQGRGFISSSAFSAMWAHSNEVREKIFLAPLTFGSAPPAASVPFSYPLAARRTPDTWSRDNDIFHYRGQSVFHAITNYAIDHDGHYPPHLAALIAGHYIRPTDLIHPSFPTTPLPIDPATLSEADWPKIAADVDAHSDLIYCGAGIVDSPALRRVLNPPGVHRELLLLYRKPLYPRDDTETYFHPATPYFASGLDRSTFMVTNVTRRELGLPPIRPNTLPPYSPPKPGAAVLEGLPSGADQAANNREVSRRNVAVILAGLTGSYRDASLTKLLSEGVIAPRHLNDPDRNSPQFAVDSVDIPKPRNRDDYRGYSAEVSAVIDRASDYVLAREAFDPGTLPEAARGLTIFSKNIYRGTGRLCGFADQTVRFVAMADLPPEIRATPPAAVQPGDPPILAPAERIAFLRGIEAEYGPHGSKAGESITLSGTLHMADGSLVPGDMRLDVQSPPRSDAPSSSKRISVVNGDFSVTVPSSTVRIYASSSQTARMVYGPYTSAGATDRLNLEVLPGVPLVIKLVDPAGKPIPGARITIRTPRDNQSGGGGFGRTDEQGLFTAAHQLPGTYDLDVDVPGYQCRMRTGAILSANAPLIWTLPPAVPATGIVVDADGRPVAGARFHNGSDNSSVMATSDAQGHFTLASLLDDTTYDLIVDGDKGRTRAEGIRAGQNNLRVKLERDISLHVTIKGSVDQLEIRNGKPTLSAVTWSKNSGDWRFGPVTIEDGVAFADIKNVWPGKINIHAGKREFIFDGITESRGLTIDLTAPASMPVQVVDSAGKELSITLTGFPKDGDLGHVTINSDSRRIEPATVRDGKVTTSILMKDYGDISDRGLLGYRFSAMHFNRDNFPEFSGTVHIEEAGAIYGQVLDEDAKPATDVQSISICATPPPYPADSGYREQTFPVDPMTGKFFITGLPLDTSYLVTATRGNTGAVSPPVTVTARRFAVRQNITLPTHTPRLVGTVATANGKPAPNLRLNFSFDALPIDRSKPFHVNGEVVTQDDGTFVIDGINPELPITGLFYARVQLNIVPVGTYKMGDQRILLQLPP